MATDFNQLDGRWLALQVRSGWELKCAADLREKGFDEIVPLYEEKRKWSDRTKIVTLPLFNGYVFVRFDLHNPLRIISVPGAIRFVTLGGRPVPIEDEEIESLQIIRRLSVPCKPCEYGEVGEDVHIQRGSLAGMHGKIVRVKGNERLVVSIGLLKRSLFLEIDRADATLLRAAGSYRCTHQPQALSASA
jgi:transcription antitermination factor NusG